MKKAGAIVLAAARAEAAKVNAYIAANIELGDVDQDSIVIYANASVSQIARAFEFGLRHPLNYPSQRKGANARNRFSNHWAAQDVKPFLDRAMEAAYTAAVDAYAEVEAELLADEYGLDTD
jgi:hypothetical protein